MGTLRQAAKPGWDVAQLPRCVYALCPAEPWMNPGSIPAAGRPLPRGFGRGCVPVVGWDHCQPTSTGPCSRGVLSSLRCLGSRGEALAIKLMVKSVVPELSLLLRSIQQKAIHRSE